METAGSCYGFGAASALPFRFLRHGGGEPLAVAVASEEPPRPSAKPVVEWQIRQDGGIFEARLYRDGGLFGLWVSGSGWYTIDPAAPSITLPGNGNAVKREARLWGIPTTLCFLARGDLALHAAAVEVEGEAILLAAPGTFGKTTLAAAFAQSGHRVLSEDLACLRVADEPAVIPGPAMLRLRRDVAELFDDLPSGARHDGGDERVYIGLDDGRRGDCTPVPLRAIVFLRAADGAVALEQVDPAEAIRDLWALSFALPTDEGRARCFERLAQLAFHVPVSNLLRPLRLDELGRTVEHLVARA